MSYDLFIFAGEASGDLHGEKLLKALQEARPDLKIKGVGGPRMRKAGLDCFLPMEEFEVMGFIDILGSLPHLRNMFKKIREEILSAKPQGVLFIDYPGFNLRLARSLKKHKTSSKLLHFVCPSVWAWGKRRIPLMEKNLDKLMTLLPFEPELFSHDLLDVEYVGHPLIARIESHEYDSKWRNHYGISEDQRILSLFPGSRQKELERNFPLQLKVAQKFLKERKEFLLTVSCSNEKFLPFLKNHAGENVKIIQMDHLYELMRASHLAIATSGTVTLELALHRVPTVVTYAITTLDTFLATKIFRINLPHYALPNVIAKDEVFPELFGPQLTEKSLTQALHELAASQLRREASIRKCESLKENLGPKNASREAVKAILQTLELS
ncbi:lipid-A-disaccharide synthase [Simkania negevensis]|uniref:Lipid-A-disaccharide synthase n=1 Tax=Simkania negevensis (strain ATCC VR-1471 / DSM 27360 / Z) TaxID=331113 RepID=F8L386_SIMNZ|nr:lipid-A-disaccharide synthase [Simkania negevensis]CCB89724.1 lipid-A-disaccharide synthase [Simkania negevensis Z]